MLLLHFRVGLSLYVIVRQRQAPRFPHGWLKISSSLCTPTCIIVSRFEMTYPAANGVSNKTSQLAEQEMPHSVCGGRESDPERVTILGAAGG